MDQRTVLHRVIFDANTRVRDVNWSDASLANIEWTRLQQFGEEVIAKKTRNARKRIIAYRTAARTYHELVHALQSQGLSSPASKFRLRENR